jgi:PAS domain S-box-containing protein
MTRDSENSTDSAWIQKYLDVAGVILVAINRDETVRLINRKGCEVLEGSEEQIVGQNWFDLFVPANQRETVREFFRRMCEGEEDLPEYYENPVLTLGGQEKLVAWHNTILSEPDGTVVGSLSSGKDVTETRKGEEALRRSEAKLRAIVDTAVDGIITIDSNGVVQSFNNAASKLFGYSPDEIVGRNVSNLMPEPDSSQHNQYIDNYFRTGQAKVMGNGREVLAQRKDGTTFPIYLAISEMSLRDRTLFAGIVHDLSEIKRMQEQVSQSQNLAAIGEMAATVAHEIKNPLAGISGAIQVLRDTLDTEDPRYHNGAGDFLSDIVLL